MSSYTNEFYAEQQAGSLRSARAVVPLVLDAVRPRSVVDVGCGVGTWLAAFLEAGVEDVLGMDGSYVDTERLLIPRERFTAVDLGAPPAPEREFDLVVSMEVAEHLLPGQAAGFVRYLAALGPVVLFSAAVPFQGGTHHVNEQWPGYWADHFREHGYLACDYLRPRIWDDGAVEWWYRQNALLFVRESRLAADAELAGRLRGCVGEPPALVHPENYLRRFAPADALPSVRGAADDLWRAVRGRLLRTFVRRG